MQPSQSQSDADQIEQIESSEVIDDIFSKMHSSFNEAALIQKCRNYSSKSLHFEAYRDENEKPFVFRSVLNAERDIADQNMDKEYSSMEGIATLNTALQKFFFGENHPLVCADRIVTFQTLSGIGALRVGLEFISTNLPTEVYVSSPIGEGYHDILKAARLTYTQYPYLDPVSRELDFDGMCKTLSEAKPGSVVLLSACAHNPTGINPTIEQWKTLAKLIKSKGLLPFFEIFSQGLASGDLETDMKAVHIFIEEEVQLLMAQCFDRNMGLYAEKVGALHVTCTNAEISQIVGSQLNLIVRRMYGLPPLHGGRIVEKILTNPQYTAEWKEDLKGMHNRITKMKALLYEELKNNGAQGDWQQIIQQTGMYWNTGFTAQQVEDLISEYDISFIQDGRMNMSYINDKNVKYVAEAIKDVTQEEIIVRLQSHVQMSV